MSSTSKTRALIAFLATSGVRIGEAAALRIGNLELLSRAHLHMNDDLLKEYMNAADDFTFLQDRKLDRISKDRGSNSVLQLSAG